MAHNVEKITVQQAAGDITKGKTPETTVDNRKIEVFSLGSGFLYPPKTTPEKTNSSLFGNIQNTGNVQVPIEAKVSTPLFGTNIVTDEKAQAETIADTANTKPGFMSTLSNYYKNIKYGISQYDAAATPNVKKALSHIPDKESLYAAIDSNKRIAAILNEAGILPA